MSLLTPFRHAPRVLVVLLALVLGARGMVASGYMLDRSAEDGTIIVRMCGLDGRDMVLDLETGALTEPGEEDAPDPDEAHATCPYAMTALFDLPLPATDWQRAAFGPPMLGDRPVLQPARRSPAHAPLPARGPPLSA